MAQRVPKLKPGTVVRVNDGESMPEFPDVNISGWTGTVLESRGRGDGLKYIIEWSQATLDQLPPEFVSLAEAQQLATEMACLSAAAVSASDAA